ncbi:MULTISPECIES: hypothetical protein [unclassified Brucella]|uniref:hypothetical protein n=1 Tax=unclassified Brucella TaxID=2632610 RepID=UPI0012AD27F0|nr:MULTISPECIES: hypothetical protein [unclassified Brucella]MRN79447.1 hypothetical protein [Brucella sp. 10RB9210]UWF59818.1 hypothetical protein NYO66_04715 [Brucella sp. 2716]
MRTIEQTDLDQLETLIDSLGLSGVLDALSIICGEKHDHILASYGDKQLAKGWERASTVIDKASAFAGRYAS